MDACVMSSPSDLNCYLGATTSDPPQSFPPSWCSSIENNQWFAFIADAATVNFIFEVLDCSSGSCLQAAILSTTDCVDFQFEGPCVSGMNPGGQYTVSATGLIPGNTYYLTVDGCAGAICDYAINGSNPLVGNANPLVCLPAPAAIYTSNIPGTWTINPPSAGTFVGPSVNVSQVAVNWTQQGPAQICVSSTTCPNENCKDIEIGFKQNTTLEVLLCAGQSVECSGNTYDLPGTYLNTYQTYQGCDSIVTCKVKSVPTYNSPLFQINKCAPNSHIVCGEEYTMTGSYQHKCTGYLGCDSIINFYLAIMEPMSIIKPPKMLDCDSNKVVTLDGTLSPENNAKPVGGLTLYNWTGPGIVGPANQATCQVNLPGTYCLVVSHTRGGVYCRDTSCVDVLADFAKPLMPTILGNPTPCNDSTVIYTVVPNGSPTPTSYTWTTPGGIAFTNVGPNSIRITWDTLINGQLCVTANNACGASPPACLPIIVQQPIITPVMSGPAVVCANGGIYLFTLDTVQLGTNYTWSVPPGAVLTGSGDLVTVNFANAGSGQVCVSVQNACGSIAPICRPVQVSPVPIVALSGGGSICQGESITLVFSTSGNGPFDVTWSNGTQNNTLTDITNGLTVVTLTPTTSTNYTLVAGNDGTNPACTANLSGGASATVNLNYVVNQTATICEHESILLGGAMQTAPGVYTDSLSSAFGCDSLILTTLTVLDIDTTQVALGTCDPAQVGVSTQVLNQTNGCDSVVITSVSLNPTSTTNLFGTSCDPNNTGVFVQNLTNIFGCDSTVTLTVTYSLSDTVLLFGSSCNPAEVGVTFDQYTSSIGCDSIVITTINFQPLPQTPLTATTCDPAAAGIFSQTLVTAAGCDSTIVTTVNLLPSNVTNLQETNCDPAAVGVFTQALINQFGCDSTVITTVSLLPSNTTNLTGQSCNPAEVGTFVQDLTNQHGCDSIVTTVISFFAIPPTPLTATTCDPAAAGVFSQTLTTAAGCDSTVVTTVSLLPSNTTNLTATSCNPANVGTFVQNLTNTVGCDSIVTTVVSFFTIPTTQLTATTCVPNEVGVFTQNLITAAGCDSAVVTTVSLLPSNTTDVALTSCNTTQVGVFVQGYFNQYGCDSIVTTTVSFVPLPTTQLTATTCNPAGVGVFSQTLVTAAGCDSTLVTTVTLLPSSSTSVTQTTCDPDKDGFFIVTLTNQFGCDSVVFLTIDLLPSNINNISLTTCNPAQVGTQTQMLTNQFGCDSTVITTTSLAPPAYCGATATATGGSIPCGSTTGSLRLTATFGLVPFGYSVQLNGTPVATGSISALNTPKTVSGLAAGTYTVVFTSLSGITTTATASIVQLLPPTISSVVLSDYGGFGVSCEGANDGTATATGTGGLPPYTYVWSSGDNAAKAIDLSANTVYTVTVTDNNNCTVTATASLTEPSPVALTFVVTNITCFGKRDGTITAKATGGIPPYRYSLNGGGLQASNVFSGLSSGVFTIRVEDASGCEATETIVVNAPAPFVVDLTGPGTIALGDTAKLEIVVNVPQDSIQSIIWGPPLDTTDCTVCFTQGVAPFLTTTYSVTVVTTGGCSDNDKITVFVDRRRYLYIPNVFSPNGDGENDIFTVYAKPNTVKNIKTMQVFNRWGEALFQLNDFQPQPNASLSGWDGNFRGQPMNPAVFAWMIEVEFVDGVTEVFTGDVTISR
ncbi:MAG: gliding motility-associated C-terminal domain-containing protein [Saprospiraceae bacterium]